MTLQKPKHLSLSEPYFIGYCNLGRNYYEKILTYDLILKQNYTTIMQLPRLDKIVLNTTSKNYVSEKKNILFTLAALELISGQKPQLTHARKSVANFKIRQSQILGCKVVLRENLMYVFLEKVSRIILPRVRDSDYKKDVTLFIQKKFCNAKKQRTKQSQVLSYTIGLKNLMSFPELENHFELVENFRGMNCTFVLSNCYFQKSLEQGNNQSALRLFLSGFQIPIY